MSRMMTSTSRRCHCQEFRGALTLHPMYRRLLKLTLEELRLIEKHLGQLDQTMPTYSPRIVTLYCASPKARYRQGAFLLLRSSWLGAWRSGRKT